MVSKNTLLDLPEGTPSVITNGAAAAPRERSQPSRFNALSHGAASEEIYLPDEDPTKREALMEDAFAQYKPCFATERALVVNYVNALWFFARRQRIVFAFENQLCHDSPDASDWQEQDLRKLELLDRYKTSAERSVQRNLANLRAIRKDQFTEEKSREQLAIQREKLALEREKADRAAKSEKESAAEMFERIQHAHDVLAARAERVPDLNAHPIQFDEEQKEWIIEQSGHIAINGEGKACVWEIEPSHAKVRELIARRSQLENEPVAVVRHFLFTDGLPKEYQFLVDEYGAKIPRGKKNFSLVLDFDFDEYLEFAAMEDKLPEYVDPEEEQKEAA